MRKSKLILLGLIWLCVMAACHRRPTMDLAAIEAILPTRPDSALAILDTLHTDPNDFTAKDRAHYYLLLTEAMDKCYLTHTTDSLIRLSADYYAAHHDNSRYAKALYLQGRIYEDWHRNDQAVACWIKALDYGKDSEDYPLLYRLTSSIGTLYAYQDDVDHALEYCQKALVYALATADSSSISYAHTYLARVHSLKRDWTETVKEYETAIAIALAAANAKGALQVAKKECIGIYTSQHAYDKVDSLISVVQADPDMVRNGPYYLVIGDYYRYVNDSVKAIPCLLEAIRLGNLYTKHSACQALSYLYEKYGMKKEQKAYERLVEQYADSIKSQEVRTVFEPAVDYQQEKIAHLSFQKIKWEVSLFLVLFVFSLSFYVYRSKKQQTHGVLVAKQNLQIKLLAHQLQLLEKKNADIEQQRIEHEQLWHQSKRLAAKNQELEKENEEIERKKEQYQQKLAHAKAELERLLQPSKALLEQMKNLPCKKPLDEKQWNDFFVLVDYYQSNFYTNLTVEYPGLRRSDIELCCLLRMGIRKNEQIATLCGIAIDSVKKRKYRLKERLRIAESSEHNDDLEALIGSL